MKTLWLWIRLGVAAAGTAAALSMGAPVAQAASVTVVMDTANPATGCGKYENKVSVPTLSAAVTAVGSNGTIVVCPGTYPAMGGPASTGVTLSGLGKVTIKQAVPGYENRPRLQVADGTTRGISIQDCSSVTIDGLVLDGTSNTLNGYRGIYFDRTTGAVRNTVLLGGIHADGVDATTDSAHPRSLTVTNAIMQGYFVGIDVSGPVKATVSGSRLDATDGGRLGPPAGIGILFEPTALGEVPTGTISKNTLINNNGAIMIDQTDKVSVSRNLFFSNSMGVLISTNGIYHSADSNKVTGNTILYIPNGGAGIILRDSDTSVPLATIKGTSISKNKISSAWFRFTGSNASGVVLAQTDSTPGLITAAISSNTFTGFANSPVPYFIFFANSGPVITSSHNTHVP